MDVRREKRSFLREKDYQRCTIVCCVLASCVTPPSAAASPSFLGDRGFNWVVQNAIFVETSAPKYYTI